MKLQLLATVLFVSILCSCDKCRETTIATKHFETEFGCEDTRHTLAIDLNNECTLISSDGDYDSKVSGTCHPEVDFSLYDLVIGKQAIPNEVDTIYYQYGIKCPENELTLSVDIIQSGTAGPDNVVYHALIPKLGDEQPLSVSLTVR
jgi:hypothetical protein